VLPGLSLRLVDSHWNLVPANPAVSADAVASLVERWRRARAMRLSTCPPKPDRAPPHWAEVGLAGVATPLRWEIRQDHAELVLCREDLRVAYHFTKETGATLLGVGATGPESGADAAGARD
jgi:hypothetical protein